VTYEIGQLVKRASVCEEHAECVKVNTSTECRGTCGEWVNEKYQYRVERRIWRLDRRICGDYREDGCPYATPLCMYERGLCVDGHCRGVSVLPKPIEPTTDIGILEIPLQDLAERASSP
jgi:hypothetical protein